jgi:hypothetical protein
MSHGGCTQQSIDHSQVAASGARQGRKMSPLISTSWSMFNMRPEKRSGRSLLSQASREVRRALRGRSTTPLRISPKVRTLKNRSSSSVASIQVVTFRAAFGLMSSEMTFVSSKTPLGGRENPETGFASADQ